MNDAVLKPLEVRKVFDLGIERGLTVVMEPSLKDYFYTILPVTGWRVSKSYTVCHLKRSTVGKSREKFLTSCVKNQSVFTRYNRIYLSHIKIIQICMIKIRNFF